MNKFWCQDVQAAADACLKYCPADAARSISIAGDVLEHRFLFRDHWEMERTHIPVQFGPKTTDIDWGHIPAGDPEWLYAMNRHSCFVNLGKAWRYTSDSRYAQTFAALISDWIEREPLNEQTGTTTWRSLEAGLRCESWLRALKLFKGSSALTPALEKTIDESLRIHGEYLEKTSGAFHMLSNWGVLQDHGLFLLGVYFNKSQWQTLALERLDKNLHRSVLRDGSHWEQSPMYHCEVLHCAADTLLIARQNKIPVPTRFEHNIYNMYKALLAWSTPMGRLLCQSDSDSTDARDMLAQGAVMFRDGDLAARAGRYPFEENYWDFGPDAAEMLAELPHGADDCSAALPDSGNYMLRSGAGKGSAYLHFHCGCLGSGHGHADLLHINAGIAGQEVLVDSGRYTYVDSPIRRQLKLPAAHNTIRVDGEDFSHCVDSWGYSKLAVPLKGQHTFTREADFVSGAHLGYLEQGVVVQRRVAFLKKAAVAVVVDTLYTHTQHSYEQYFHFGEGQLTRFAGGARWQSAGASAQLFCLGEGLALSIEPAPHSRDYNRLESGEMLKVSRSAKGVTSFVSVLSLQENGDEKIVAELLPVSRQSNGHHLPASEAEAVRIQKNGAEYTVIAAHAEVISEVDMLAANGHAGYGKLLVFGPEMPDGLCLEW